MHVSKVTSVVSNLVWPCGLWPTRLCPGDSPGKNTGGGCHGDLPNPGAEAASPMSPVLAGVFTASATWEILLFNWLSCIFFSNPIWKTYRIYYQLFISSGWTWCVNTQKKELITKGDQLVLFWSCRLAIFPSRFFFFFLVNISYTLMNEIYVCTLIKWIYIWMYG